ncbi:hypothetical protein PV10_00206 [Exophiala mesophila]|uniref:Uncharacterized protein n=1 Tax=Exophiala mesophila TaxID=212818 RepID=A0A0D1ZQR4_EXOME|nr:uncharacterized protein PV10_00206 [Exophiala mesophila]KIV96324.1 hypothetical protein PV10_00206 [Exophiala mesophila]
MAPPEHPFPVSKLEQRIHTYSVDMKEKNRKLGDFDLKRDCELFELIQYSCTTPDQMYQQRVNSPDGKGQMECYPFARLFRRCKKGNQEFNVETTAWEGELAWKPPKIAASATSITNNMDSLESQNTLQKYWSYFWSPK